MIIIAMVMVHSKTSELCCNSVANVTSHEFYWRSHVSLWMLSVVCSSTSLSRHTQETRNHLTAQTTQHTQHTNARTENIYSCDALYLSPVCHWYFGFTHHKHLVKLSKQLAGWCLGNTEPFIRGTPQTVWCEPKRSTSSVLELYVLCMYWPVFEQSE